MQIIEVFQTNVDSEDLAIQVIDLLALAMHMAEIKSIWKIATVH